MLNTTKYHMNIVDAIIDIWMKGFTTTCIYDNAVLDSDSLIYILSGKV
jgi:hypothetical protein